MNNLGTCQNYDTMGFWRFVHKRYYVTHYPFGVQSISCQSWTNCFVKLIGNCLKVVLYHGLLPMYLFSGRYCGYTTQSCMQISRIIYQLYGTIKSVTSLHEFFVVRENSLRSAIRWRLIFTRNNIAQDLQSKMGTSNFLL